MESNETIVFQPKFKRTFDLKKDYKLNVINKSKPKPKQFDLRGEEFKPFISPTCVPADLLPGNKKATQRLRDVVNPKNWLPQDSGKKLSRKEVFDNERENITRDIQRQQNSNRAARLLNLGITKDPSNKFEDTFNYDAPDSMASSVSNANRERKSKSKEYLQSVFARAKTYAQETKIQKSNQANRQPMKVRKPQLASGIDPNDEEIVL